MTALQYVSAYASAYANIVTLLVERGASVHVKDDWGYTPLHKASVFGKNEVIQVLLERGAQVNVRNINNAMHVSLYCTATIINCLDRAHDRDLTGLTLLIQYGLQDEIKTGIYTLGGLLELNSLARFGVFYRLVRSNHLQPKQN